MEFKVNEQDSKLMLHIHNGKQEGTTAFFRNRCLFNTVLKLMHQRPQKEFVILFHACSIGAEVYSFVIHYFLQAMHAQFDLHVYATDINSSFLKIAQQGFYPDHILKAMNAEEIEYFQFSENRFVTPIDKVRNKITFLHPVSFIEYITNRCYDVVFALNALNYVSVAQQTLTIHQIAKYNSFLLCVSEFHPDTIKKDLQLAGYIPVLTNMKEIHQAWSDDSHLSEKLDLSQTPDYQYKLCSIFKKKNGSLL